MDRKDFESLLNNYPDCVSDGKKLKAFLKDLYPDVPKAIVNTLTIMADDGIISEMQMSTASSSLVSARLQKKLEDDYGLSQKIISECFSLIIYDSAKQPQTTNNARSHENINVSAHTTSKSASKKENFPKNTTKSGEKPLPQSIPAKNKTIKQTNTNFAFDPKDFEIVKGVLKKYKGSSSVVVIPDNVTSIGSQAFYNCKGLTSVTILDSVKSIGLGAFEGCSSLESITIPFVGAKAGVTSSDTYQYPFGYIFGTSSYTGSVATTQYYFGDSTSSTTYDTYYIPSSLKSVTVTGGNILYRAFSGCKGLTSVTIPDSVTSIGDYAFYTCSGLTIITIPDGVTSIGSCAFAGCTGLTSITIPDSVTSVGLSAFYDCNGLTSVTVGNRVTSIGWYAFKCCRGLTSITIPNSVTSIGDDVFYDCNGLTSITIGNRVTSIGDYAFHGCTGLTSITIPNSVTSIGDFAFYNCTGLMSITIPNSVTSIGNNAFSGCTGLTSVTIPDSVTSIGYDAFSGCKNLTIYCEAKSKPIGWSSFFEPGHRPVVWGVKNKA